MDIKYICEVCNSKFNSREECLKHEEECYGRVINFTCDKCGKNIQWIDNDNAEALIKSNISHYVYLGRMGYGSKLDGSDISFYICDECLYDLIQTFKNKDKIICSGSNCYFEYEDDLS